jgi:hypothetical protein
MKKSNKIKKITIAISPELYRQSRMLAAEFDVTITGMVAGLIQSLPNILVQANFPVGGPKPTPAPESAEPVEN